jgi:hypothetical protein
MHAGAARCKAYTALQGYKQAQSGQHGGKIAGAGRKPNIGLQSRDRLGFIVLI